MARGRIDPSVTISGLHRTVKPAMNWRLKGIPTFNMFFTELTIL